MKLGKAHVTLDGPSHTRAGDSCREKGGTQKYLIIRNNRMIQILIVSNTSNRSLKKEKNADEDAIESSTAS